MFKNANIWLTDYFLNHATMKWAAKIEPIIEEALEMLGIIIIIKGLLEYYNFLNKPQAVGR